MGLNKNTTRKKFVSISMGKLRQRVTPEIEGAKEREITKNDGSKHIIHELVFDSLSGYITGLSFRDNDFGRFLSIEIDGVILSLNTGYRFFSSFARKFPSIDLKKEISLAPYDFEGNGKNYKGISTVQEGLKVRDYFYDGKENLHGMPEPKDTMEKDDWKIYFLQVEKFLVNFIEEAKKEYKEVALTNDEIKMELSKEENLAEGVPEIDYESDINPEDLPF